MSGVSVNSHSLQSSVTNKNANKGMPLLRNVSPIEQDIVSRMYRMYDHDLKGQIPNYLARNLMSQLGIHITNLEVVFSQEVSLAEILLLLDQMIPDPEPSKALEGGLSTFNGMVAKEIYDDETDEVSRALTPVDISTFMESLGRPAASVSEATLMLNAMNDYDDVAEVPVLQAKVFTKEVLLYAKKSNCLREFEKERNHR